MLLSQKLTTFDLPSLARDGRSNFRGCLGIDLTEEPVTLADTIKIVTDDGFIACLAQDCTQIKTSFNPSSSASSLPPFARAIVLKPAELATVKLLGS